MNYFRSFFCKASSELPKKGLHKNHSGQAVLEYVLLMAVLFVTTLMISAAIRDTMFGEGLRRLPAKVSACLSHPTQGGGDCR